MNEHKCGGNPCDPGLQEEKEPCFIVPKLEKEISELKAQNNQLNTSVLNCDKKVEILEEKVCSLLNCQHGCDCDDGDCQCICPSKEKDKKIHIIISNSK